MPIPEPKQSKERRQHLLRSSLQLFISKGYFNTAIRDIIASSGVGTGTFYNYFIDKEDVLKALLEEFADQIITGISQYYLEEEDLYERFVETKRITMEILARNQELSELYSRVAGASESIDQCLKVFEDKLIGFYSRNIEYGIKKGRFKNVPVPPVAHPFCYGEVLSSTKWVVLKDISNEEMIEMVVSFHETLARGLLAD